MKREVVVLVSLSILLLTSCSLPASQRLAIEPAGMVFAEIIAGECASNSIQTCNTSCSIVSVSRVVPCCGAEATLKFRGDTPRIVSINHINSTKLFSFISAFGMGSGVKPQR